MAGRAGGDPRPAPPRCAGCGGSRRPATQRPAPRGAWRGALQDVQPQPDILVGDEGAVEVARHPACEAVVTGIVGCAGLLPTVAAIKAGK